MKTKLFLIAVLYFISVIGLAHFFVPPIYDWTQNTVSDLAAQGHVYKWIMQVGFIGFGLMLTSASVLYFTQNRKLYFLWFVAAYALSILVTGFFCAAAIDPSFEYSVPEANIHSLFATIAGICMSIGIVWQIFASSTNYERGTRLAFLILVMGISALFGLAENHILEIGKGIVQRSLYLAGLMWLVYEESTLSTKGEIKT